ncbi:MAG: PspC domain-containing protein [Bacteroidia bacterium]|nr:PspC domain-containing protein [Bacteroidia bacterium]
MEKRLTRKNKMLMGVCGGIADYFNMDVVVVRLIAVGLLLLGVGSPVIIYIIMAIVVPDENHIINN